MGPQDPRNNGPRSTLRRIHYIDATAEERIVELIRDAATRMAVSLTFRSCRRVDEAGVEG